MNCTEPGVNRQTPEANRIGETLTVGRLPARFWTALVLQRIFIWQQLNRYPVRLPKPRYLRLGAGSGPAHYFQLSQSYSPRLNSGS